MFRKFIYLLCFSFIFSAGINEVIASRVANNLISERSNRDDLSISSYELIQDGNIDLYYIFSLNPVGFIIVAADDRSVPILGYSFENDFILNIDRNTNASHLLNTFKEQIIEAVLNNINQNEDVIVKWEKYLSANINPLNTRTVTPLLTARFDQGVTWNEECPEDGAGPGGHALVGCVAVSMAQVMYYWEYPTVGTGSEGYNSPYGYLSANFGNTTYNYTEMESNTGNYHSQVLSFHCGVAVNMNYGPDGSGAYVMGGGQSARNAMRNYFGFKNNIVQAYPENYSTSAYRQLLQDDLDLNRPIIYRACSTDGCHAWNIDGYEEDEFHCNWGWGGYNNGYFPLSTLGGFSYDQGVLLNLEPEDLDVPHIVLNEFSSTEINGDFDSNINPGETIEIVVDLENYIPWSNATNLEVVLDSPYNDIEISDNIFEINFLSAGSTFSNTNSPFTIDIANDIDLGVYTLTVSIVGENYYVAHDLDIEVSLKQAGFPFINIEAIESSPITVDRDGDGKLEIYYGDYGGIVHGLDYLGQPISGFPIQLDGANNDIWASPSIDDLDLDGHPEIVINSKNGHLYVIDLYGNIELDIDLDDYLMGSPALGDIDGDGVNEIVISTYASSGKVHAINYDGSFVPGFPVDIDEKVLRGAALYDFNNNGKDDIVVATESDDNIILIYDNASFEILFTAENKFKSAPNIALINNQPIIFAGSDDDHMYGIYSNGELAINIDTGSNIRTSTAFMNTNQGVNIFFGSSNGRFYGVDSNGNNLPGWPIELGGNISTSPIACDIDGDGISEIFVGTSDLFYGFNESGLPLPFFPIDSDVGILGSSFVADIDNDGDQEIFFGANTQLYGIDIKTNSSPLSEWSMYRGNHLRNGFFNSQIDNSNLGDINGDFIVDILDIVILVNLILGQNPEPGQMELADVNNDGVLSILDIVIVINIALDI